MPHPQYNKDNYPVFIVNNGNWDIYANRDRTYCAAIPTEEAARNGCNATHFGDARYVRVTLGVDVSK